MPWFRVDDDAGTHPKLLAAGDSAVGLWVRAGAYVARYTLEGHVSRRTLRTLGGTQRQVRALVEARLWVEDPAGDGWRFWQWDDRQPTREEVAADRAAAAERQRRMRARRREAAAAAAAAVDDAVDNSAELTRGERGTRTGRARGARETGQTPDTREDKPAGQRDSSRRESRHPGPARPGPTYLLTYLGRLAVGDAGAYDGPPAEQLEAWQAIAGPHVDLNREAATYLARHGSRPARDPVAAWDGWLKAARKRADAEHRAPLGCERCVDGWLDDDPGTGNPRPCPTCRPRHLRPVDDARGQTA